MKLDYMTNPVLVSGGCGFVGRNVVKRLLKEKRNIVIIDDLSTGRNPDTWLPKPFDVEIVNDRVRSYHLTNSNVLFVHDDFSKILLKYGGDTLSQYFNEVGAFESVYHLAAIVGGRLKIDGDPICVAKDLALDSFFFQWAVEKKPSKVLYPSSSAAYPVHLQTVTNQIQLFEHNIGFGSNMGMPDMTYGWSKLTGEYLAQIAHKHYGLRVAVIRPFSGYGEDQEVEYPIPAIVKRAVLKEDPFVVWGSGKQGRDFVHIDDCVNLIFLLMEKVHDASAFNIGTGKLTSFLDIIQIVSKIAGYKPTIKPLLDKPVGVYSRYCSIEKAQKELGWNPKITIEEGLRRVYDHVKESIK